MKKTIRTKTWLLIFAALIVVCGAAVWLLFRGSGSASAEIWSDGVLIRTVDLRQDQTFTVESAEGTNVVSVSGGEIRVTEATCPDQICVARGAASGGAPIVCLPNRLVVKFSGSSDASGVDAAVG